MTYWGDKFGINTYSYTQSMPAATCVRTLAERGVNAVELMFFPGHLWFTDAGPTLRELRSTIESSGMSLVTLNTPNIDLNIAAATTEMREYSLAINIEYLRVAGELGAQALILGPGKPNPLFPMPRETMEEHFFRALDRLLPTAENHGVEIWVENMPFAFLPGLSELMASLDRYGADAIGIVYDVANAHFIGEDPVAGIHQVGSRLRLVHLSDTSRSVYRHDAVGLGDVDFAAIMPHLNGPGLGHPPMLEIIAPAPDDEIGRSIEALSALN